MMFLRSFRSKNHSSSQTTLIENAYPAAEDNPNTILESKTAFESKPVTQPSKIDEQVLLQIPSSSVHIIDEGESIELTRGDFRLVLLAEESAPLATVIKIGDVQWPLAKDEPVVKMDDRHYLFTLPDEEGGFLSYGVSFSDNHTGLALLDSFLKENSCFSAQGGAAPPYSSSSQASRSASLEGSKSYWKEYAPRIEDYNGMLAKAIAGGTGQIVKGIFTCSNAYCEQVKKTEVVRTGGIKDNADVSAGKSKKSGRLKRSVKRVRKLSKMTEKMSRALLDGVLMTTGSVTRPMVRSTTGKKLLSMVPGEVLLASLDAINKVLEAVEVAEKDAFSTTTGTVTGMVTQRFGEDAGEVTEDVFATAGHAIGTAWNVFKIRKTINPKSAMSSAIVNSVGKKRTGRVHYG